MDEDQKPIEINIDHSKVESEDLDFDDLIDHPEKYLVINLEAIIICKECHKRYSIRKTKKSVTFLCGCGCRIFYPKNKYNTIISAFILPEKKKGVDKNARRSDRRSNS